MDLLIAVVGNAVVDPVFRKKLLDDPVQALDDWGFRLTKREVELLEEMFAQLGARKEELAEKFECLGKALYRNIDQAAERKVAPICPKRTCPMSVYPQLPELRNELRKFAITESEKPAA
jgi:hypothetical protein